MTAPKLRFKEFDGDWPSVPLKDFVSFRKGKGISKADIQEDGTFQCIRYGELYTTYGQVITTIKSRTNISPSESILSQNGDVIIPASGETQIDIATASCVAKENVILGGDLNILSHQESGEWLAYYLSSAKKLEIAQLAQGNSVVHLYSSQLKELKVNKPTKEEQTKIASFLSAVDEKISQLTQKHQLLSQYKQGMMQKLFSQQIRFKADDGSEFGEWEETILSDIVNLFHGYQFRTSDFTSKGIAVIKIGNVIGNNLDLANLTYINENRLEDFKKFEILNGDILMSLTGNIGRIIEVKNKPFIILQNYRVGKFIPLNENFLIKPFLKYLLTSDLVFGRFSQLANQSAQANFGKQDMDKIAVFYPSVSEQTKIANFLSSIDQKIDVVSEQLEQAKLWKKGLLQQMFV